MGDTYGHTAIFEQEGLSNKESENIILPLDEEIYPMGRIILAPVPGSTSNCVINVGSAKFSVSAPLNSVNKRLPFSEGRRSQLGQAAEQAHIVNFQAIPFIALLSMHCGAARCMEVYCERSEQ